MTKQKHTKAVDAASNAEELLPLEQMMSQGSASNEGAAHAVDETNQVTDGEHRGTEGVVSALVPKLRFAGFTVPWQSVCLKDVVTSFEYGLNAPAKDYDFFTKYLRITDIDEDSRKFLTTDLKSPDIEAAKASKYLAQDGDLFFARTASVGRTYLYSKSDGRVVFAGYLIRGHVRQDSVSPDFVFYSTLTAQYDMFVAATSARSVQPGINAAEYGSYQFAVPSLVEQQRIGAFFKELDHNIELNRELLEKLTQLKKSMLEQMFPREGESLPRLRFAGFTEPWEGVCLGDIAYFEHSICIASNYVSTENMLPDFQGISFTIENMAHVSQHQGFGFTGTKYEPNDVLISNIRPYLKKIWLADVGGCCSPDVLVLRLINHQKVVPQFLFYVLASNWFIAYVMKAVKGSKMPRGDKGHMLQAIFAVPSIAEQQCIGKFFKALDQRITQQRAKLEKLGQLKKALLEQMFV